MWLEQASLLITAAGKKILVDPYFSRCVEAENPSWPKRKDPPAWVWDIRPDVLVFTHDHIDHCDPETFPRILASREKILVLCSPSTWDRACAFGGSHNYIRFARHAEWTEGGVRISAVKAEHSDPAPIGVVIEAEGKTLWVSGDTLYSSEIPADLPERIDVAFFPVNGVGNNMNAVDAKRLADAAGVKRVVPLHVGMYDSLTPDVYPGDEKWVLTPYKEYEL